MIRILLAALLGLLAVSPASAQKTKAAIQTEITTLFSDNVTGLLTPAKLRTVTTDIVNSYVDWLTCTTGGGLVYWSGGTPACLLAGTLGQPLLSNGASAPSWATVSYPASANSGGIACFTSTTAMVSSVAQTTNAIVLGGGAGTCPSPLGSLGTTTTVLHGNAAGPPTFGSIVNGDLAANTITNGSLATMAANTVKANATGGAAAPTDVTPAAARSSSLLNVDGFTGHGDSIYTILATDRTVGTNAAFTASRTWTLPAASAVNAGQEVIVADFQGTVTNVNTLVIARAGSDTINGATSVTISAANGAVLLKSDGTSKWTAQPLGTANVAGVSSVTCGTGLSGGTITTTGTCAVSLTTANNVLGSDVAMNVSANYFDGPSMAQGTSGTWWVGGSVVVLETTSANAIFCKLWDGTTIIASGAANANSATATPPTTVHLSGILASPAANIKISCRDSTGTAGVIKFNSSGNSKDSSIYGFRIQ